MGKTAIVGQFGQGNPNLVAHAIDEQGFDGVLVGHDCFIADLDYADGITLLQPDELSMQRLLDVMARIAGSVGLKIKPAKTKAMAICAPQPQLQVDGEQIEAVASFCFLGSIISAQSIAPTEDVTSRIGKASATFNRLALRLWRRWNITSKTKMKIFNASVIPVLLYGCETGADPGFLPGG